MSERSREELEAEIATLRDQVKALVRVESKLHMAQGRLDAQMRTFRKLYELGERNNANFDLASILKAAPEFAVAVLGYQRCVVLLDDRSTGAFTVRAHEGFYGSEWGDRLASVTLAADDPLVARVRQDGMVLHRDAPDATAPAFADALGMHSFLAFPLDTGSSRLVGLLLAGCSRDEEQFHTRVEGEGEARYSVASLAAQTSAAVNRCLLFRELAEERNQLDEKVRQRTRELSEAYENLEHLNSLKTKFFANVSHELRTPLTLSVGPLELVLGDAKLDASLEPALRSIYRNQLRLQKLINDLLDFSKLEAGQMTTRFAPVDLGAIVRTHVSLFEGAAKSRRMKVVAAIPDERVEVYLDEEKFEKIILNLLSNAFKFTPDGGTLRVEIEPRPDAVLVHVSDTGIGIPEEARPRIFDRFFQVESSDTRRYQGTGIGLAMVREFTELHGGTVTVDSEVGVGTTFHLAFRRGSDHLPAASIAAEPRGARAPHAPIEVDVDDEAPPRDGPEATEEPPRLAPPSVRPPAPRRDDGDAGRPKVLVVDDTKDMRVFLASVLRAEVDVVTARDGLDALEKLRAFVPDLIVSDVMMPNMSGKELCARVKASPGPLGRTPVILVTAQADTAMKLEGLESGADDYLVKPFDVAELLCRTRNLVALRRHERRLAEAHAALERKDRRLQEDLVEARAFQQRLLPTLPASDALAFAAVYRPVDLVGGDIYDVFETRPGRFRVFVADATGHGVQASLRTMTLKAEYEQLRGLDAGPGAVLQALNRRLATSYSPMELLCTGACLDVEVAPGGGALVRYASAAQPPSVLLARGGATEVGLTGPLLGTSRVEIEIPEMGFEMAAGDRLLVFTDGLCEQCDAAGTPFDVRAVAARVADADAPLDAVLAEFDAFVGARGVLDDVTALSIACVSRLRS